MGVALRSHPHNAEHITCYQMTSSDLIQFANTFHSHPETEQDLLLSPDGIMNSSRKKVKSQSKCSYFIKKMM